jgi:hypothetical protein
MLNGSQMLEARISALQALIAASNGSFSQPQTLQRTANHHLGVGRYALPLAPSNPDRLLQGRNYQPGSLEQNFHAQTQIQAILSQCSGSPAAGAMLNPLNLDNGKLSTVQVGAVPSAFLQRSNLVHVGAADHNAMAPASCQAGAVVRPGLGDAMGRSFGLGSSLDGGGGHQAPLQCQVNPAAHNLECYFEPSQVSAFQPRNHVTQFIANHPQGGHVQEQGETTVQQKRKFAEETFLQDTSECCGTGEPRAKCKRLESAEAASAGGAVCRLERARLKQGGKWQKEAALCKAQGMAHGLHRPKEPNQQLAFRNFLMCEDRKNVVRLTLADKPNDPQNPLGVSKVEVLDVDKWWADVEMWFEDDPKKFSFRAFFMMLRRLGFRPMNKAAPPATTGLDFYLRNRTAKTHGYVHDANVYKRYRTSQRSIRVGLEAESGSTSSLEDSRTNLWLAEV